MDWGLFWRYWLDAAALYPAAALCFAPVLEFVRSPRRTLPLVAAVLTVIVSLGALVCMLFRWDSNWFLLAELVLEFFLFRRLLLPSFSRGRAAFAFLMGMWLLVVSVLLSMVVNARAELANTQPICLTSTALLCLVFLAVLGAFYCAVAVPWVSWMLRGFQFERVWRTAWILPAICTACYVYFLPRDSELILREHVQEVAVLAIMISLMLIFLLLYVFYRSGREYVRSLKLAQENHLLLMESQRYQELRAYMEHTRVLRHDFRQHLHVICGLAEAGRLEELQHYLRQYEGELSAPRPTICANAALDAIAGHYELQARRAQIPVTWQIALPDVLPLPEEELCMVLGNLLENALRACAVLPPEKRRVCVSAQMLSPLMLGLIVENTYDDARPDATPAGEGIGLTSVQTVADKYSGQMTVETDAGIFRVNLLMNL